MYQKQIRFISRLDLSGDQIYQVQIRFISWRLDLLDGDWVYLEIRTIRTLDLSEDQIYQEIRLISRLDLLGDQIYQEEVRSISRLDLSGKAQFYQVFFNTFYTIDRVEIKLVILVGD